MPAFFRAADSRRAEAMTVWLAAAVRRRPDADGPAQARLLAIGVSGLALRGYAKDTLLSGSDLRRDFVRSVPVRAYTTPHSDKLGTRTKSNNINSEDLGPVLEPSPQI